MRKRVKRPEGHELLTPIENAAKPKVSVVIPAMNELRTIAQVIKEARNVHPDTEVIVVANGSSDGTPAIAERMGAKVIHYTDRLGHDVGRGVGALAAKGEIILFTDADIVIAAELLSPFVNAVEQGVDIALNSYKGAVKKKIVHRVILAKWVLNALLAEHGLGGASMTAIPHAISRRALEEIGAEQLAVPPKAQAIAVTKGLCIAPAAYVNVGKTNPIRRTHEAQDSVKHLIVGDHLEAIHWLLEQHGDSRAVLPDLGRKRERVSDEW